MASISPDTEGNRLGTFKDYNRLGVGGWVGGGARPIYSLRAHLFSCVGEGRSAADKKLNIRLPENGELGAGEGEWISLFPTAVPRWGVHILNAKKIQSNRPTETPNASCF